MDEGEEANDDSDTYYQPCCHVIPEVWSGHEATVQEMEELGVIEPHTFIGVVGFETWFGKCFVFGMLFGGLSMRFLFLFRFCFIASICTPAKSSRHLTPTITPAISLSRLSLSLFSRLACYSSKIYW